MLYEVSYWVPSRHESGWHCEQRFVCGSKREAELWAEDKLPLTTESDYGYRVNRRPFIEAVPFQKKGYFFTEVGNKTVWEQPVRIVHSVGELGWTP